MQDTTMDVRQIWKTLCKRRSLIGKIFLAFVLLAVIISFVLPPTYEGEVLLRVKQPKGLADSLLGDITGGSPLATKQLMATYAEILKSRVVVEQTIIENKIGLDPDDAEKELEKYESFINRINTQPVRDTEILRIKVTAPSALTAQVWANSLVDKFLGRITSLVREEQSVVRDFIGERLKEARKELERAEGALAEYKLTQKIAAPADETKAIVDRLSTANQLTAQNEVALAAAQGKLANAQRQLGSQSPGFLADGPLIQQYKGKLAEQELELAKLRQMYTDKHPRVLTLQASIAETKLRLSNEISRIVNAESPAANPIHLGILQARIQAEAEMASAVAQRQALQKMMTDWENELTKLPSKEQGMARVTRDAMVAQEIYTMLAKRFEEARISEVMQPTDAQVVNPAVEPDKPIRPRKVLNVVIAAVLGLCAGIGSAFAIEFMNRTIRTADDVKEYLDLPVLGAIPHFDSELVPQEGEFTKAMNRIRSVFGDRRGSR